MCNLIPPFFYVVCFFFPFGKLPFCFFWNSFHPSCFFLMMMMMIIDEWCQDGEGRDIKKETKQNKITRKVREKNTQREIEEEDIVYTPLFSFIFSFFCTLPHFLLLLFFSYISLTLNHSHIHHSSLSLSSEKKTNAQMKGWLKPKNEKERQKTKGKK